MDCINSAVSGGMEFSEGSSEVPSSIIGPYRIPLHHKANVVSGTRERGLGGSGVPRRGPCSGVDGSGEHNSGLILQWISALGGPGRYNALHRDDRTRGLDN